MGIRLSVSARILAAFSVLLAGFAGVGAYGVTRFRAAESGLRVLSKGHLRLAFALNELEATQSSLVNLIGDGQTLGLRTMRRLRLRKLDEARQIARETLRLGPSAEDTAFLRRLANNLHSLEEVCQQSEAAFEATFGAGAAAAGSAASVRRGAVVADLARREGEVLRLVRSARDLARSRVTDLSQELEHAEERTVWGYLALVVAVLIVGVVVAFAASRTLRPLRALADGARAIAGGHYSRRVPTRAGDEIGQLAEEFNRMAGALEEREARLVRSERLAAAGRVAGHVAHEVRNPLSSIGLNAELLEEEVGQSVEGRRLLAAIRSEVDRLEALTEEYLKFGRLPQPKLAPENLSPLLGELVAFVTPEMQESGIEIRTQLRELPQVAADETQLRQAFMNLVRNAREAMVGGGTLAIETLAANGHVEVRVSDTGPGIEPAVLANLFEPFLTTKKGGTGLGLALTHQIVTEHGGSIDVQSESGRGTTFIVRFPMQRPETT